MRQDLDDLARAWFEQGEPRALMDLMTHHSTARGGRVRMVLGGRVERGHTQAVVYSSQT